MDNKIKILTGIMTDMPESDRLEVIEICKMIQLFLYHLETYNEIALGKVCRSFNTPAKTEMAESVLKNLGLKKIQRKKSNKSRRAGTAWVKK